MPPSKWLTLRGARHQLASGHRLFPLPNPTKHDDMSFWTRASGHRIRVREHERIRDETTAKIVTAISYTVLLSKHSPTSPFMCPRPEQNPPAKKQSGYLRKNLDR